MDLAGPCLSQNDDDAVHFGVAPVLTHGKSTVPADKTGRSIFFNCSRPGCRNDLKFFSLCPCLYWAPATKVSSRPDENILSESLYNRPHGTKFYQLKAKMEANKVPSCTNERKSICSLNSLIYRKHNLAIFLYCTQLFL